MFGDRCHVWWGPCLVVGAMFGSVCLVAGAMVDELLPCLVVGAMIGGECHVSWCVPFLVVCDMVDVGDPYLMSRCHGLCWVPCIESSSHHRQPSSQLAMLGVVLMVLLVAALF